MRKWLFGFIAILVVMAGALTLSPWPGVYVIRAIFDRGAATAAAKLERHLPQGVSTITAAYDPSDADAILDVHQSADAKTTAPIVVWIHGGGFVSGRRQDLTNYLTVLAGKGITVVNVDYTIAPGATYPTPVRQVIKALEFLIREGAGLGLDTSRIVLAGDSAGAQIAAQTTAVLTNADYARTVGVVSTVSPDRLAGVLLFCGIYDISEIGRDGGILGWFVGTTGWAYSGQRNWRDSAEFATINIVPAITSNFPPTFISAGNADPLESQSVALERALRQVGIVVEPLFFPDAYKPALGHEYQFDLDTDAGQLAMARAVAWLNGL